MAHLLDADRQRIARLVARYGAEPVLDELCRHLPAPSRYGSRSAADPEQWQRLAADIRAAIRRRHDAADLVAYRQDWGEQSWLDWIAVHVDQPDLYSHVADALTRAGCARASTLALLHLRRVGEGRLARLGSRLPPPGDQDGWVSYLRTHSDELADARSFLDICGWLTAHGWPEEYGQPGGPDTFLTARRGRLPRELQRLVPDLTTASTGPYDPSDTSMFE